MKSKNKSININVYIIIQNKYNTLVISSVNIYNYIKLFIFVFNNDFEKDNNVVDVSRYFDNNIFEYTKIVIIKEIILFFI